MRYFFVAYQATNKVTTGPSIGNVYFPAKGFPSKKEVRKVIFNMHDNSSIILNEENIIITYIFEFKTPEDFYAFKG